MGTKRLRDDGTAYKRTSQGNSIEIDPTRCTAFEHTRHKRRKKRADKFGPERIVVETREGLDVLDRGHELPFVERNGRPGVIRRRCLTCKEKKE